MKSKEYLKELKNLSKSDLLGRARALSEELMKLRFRKASGQLEKSSQISLVRRNLARVKTQITAVSKDAAKSA